MLQKCEQVRIISVACKADRLLSLHGSPARNLKKAKVLLMKAWKKAVGALAMTTLVASMFTGCGKKDAAKKDSGNEIKIGAANPPTKGYNWRWNRSMPKAASMARKSNWWKRTTSLSLLNLGMQLPN